MSKIIDNVKKKGKAVLNYEKKFSKLKLKSIESLSQKSAIYQKIDIKIKQAIDLAYNRIKISF